jgi:hypothetical protein
VLVHGLFRSIRIAFADNIADLHVALVGEFSVASFRSMLLHRSISQFTTAVSTASKTGLLHARKRMR